MKRRHRLLEKVKNWLQVALSLPFWGGTYRHLAGVPSFSQRWKDKYLLLSSDLFVAEFDDKVRLPYDSTISNTALEYFQYGMVYAARQELNNAVGCWQGLLEQVQFKDSIVLRNNLACLVHAQGSVAMALQLLGDATTQFNQNQELFTDLPDGRDGAEKALNQNRLIIGVSSTTPNPSAP